MVKLSLLVLGAAALVSASPLSNDEADEFPFIMTDVEESSKGFHLVPVPTDGHNPLASSIKDSTLMGYHYGAGHKLPVFHKIDDSHPVSVFYLNQKPGNPEVIMTDAGPFPYSFNVPAPREKHVMDVLLPVGDLGTPVAISNPGKQGGAYVINGLDTFGEGTFLACKRQVPYFNYAELIVLQYAYNNRSEVPGCVPIRLELQCAELPPPPPAHPSLSGPISQTYVKTVPCSRKVDA